ncbi:MAG: glycine zipper domain-containing protein [Bacteriovoracia bacterium]
MKRQLFGVILLAAAGAAAVGGCATMRDSVLLGAGVGAGSGALIGYGAGDKGSSALVGAGIGAATGALFGLIVHKNNESKGPKATSKDEKVAKFPQLNDPQVKSIWVPDKLSDDGRQYEEGHYLYLIDKPSSFSKE